MCIIVGPVKPSNTILCLKGLRQISPPTTTTESKTEGDAKNSPSISQIQLFYINNLVSSSKDKKISGGVMIVPIAYTTNVPIKGEKEDDDEITPFFVDVKGESLANIAQVTEKSVKPPTRGSPRSDSRSLPLSSSAGVKSRSAGAKLEVVELKHGGYNVSFAPSLKDLEERIDLTKLKLSESEWTEIYENTKLRFGGGDKKEEKKTGGSSYYGFVVAVPRPGAEIITRSGFSLVYWTQLIEFPTVHEQTTKTTAPKWVDMDATLLGWNIGIPQKHGGAGTQKDYNKVRYLVDDSKQSEISQSWKNIDSKIKEEKLPTQGTLNEKPKNIFSSDLHFISYLSFKGRYLNINLPGVFLPNEKLKQIKEHVEKIPRSEKAKDILSYQTTVNKSLSIIGQEPIDVLDDDSSHYKSYVGLQMVVESYVSSVHQSLI